MSASAFRSRFLVVRPECGGLGTGTPSAYPSISTQKHQKARATDPRTRQVVPKTLLQPLDFYGSEREKARASGPRTHFFASETPNYGQFHTTVFNEKWKLVQVISSSLMEVNVNNQLFDILAILLLM